MDEGSSALKFQMISLVSLMLSGFVAACSGQGGPASPRPLATVSTPQAQDDRAVHLTGLSYEVLRSGPSDGPRPLRSDDVSIRYVGRLADGSVFSTSANGGAEPSTFSVRSVIPGFSALVQLMRPGDRWRFMIPAYLGYGHAGRRFTPPEATLKRDIPPGSELIFDVELVSITPSS
jgi:FKBP-type peptidyl-prolyl cis-trans isomerase